MVFLQYFISGRSPWDTGISPPELIEFIGTHAPGMAIDMGCGTGMNILTLSAAGWKVIGIDYALPAVIKARRRLKRSGNHAAKILQGDVTNLEDLDGRFDLILDIGCYHSLNEKNRMRYRNNLRKLLTEDGSWLVYGHLKPQQSDAIGFSEKEIVDLAIEFKVMDRKDGLERPGRASVWLKVELR